MFPRTIFLITLFAASSAFAYNGCGSHGGPGYRAPDGHCVSWANLKVVCGDPPGSPCTNERNATAQGPAIRIPPTLKPRPHRATASVIQRLDHAGAVGDPFRGSEELPLNPDVTQMSIGHTICVKGWTATVRPPASYTSRIKVHLLREQGLPLELIGDFQLDHRIPLALGGAPSDLRNLRLEDADDADKKDDVEKCLARAVCAGRIALDEARRRIWTDWKEAAKACP